MKIKLLRDIDTSSGTILKGTVYNLKGIALSWIAIPLGNNTYFMLYEGDYEVLK